MKKNNIQKMPKELSAENGTKPIVGGSAITLRKILKSLEVNYGWSFYDENDKLHLTDMQKELIIDVARATKEMVS
jgi:hypothetical protein